MDIVTETMSLLTTAVTAAAVVFIALAASAAVSKFIDGITGK
jgi:hypothetical protein